MIFANVIPAKITGIVKFVSNVENLFIIVYTGNGRTPEIYFFIRKLTVPWTRIQDYLH